MISLIFKIKDKISVTTVYLLLFSQLALNYIKIIQHDHILFSSIKPQPALTFTFIHLFLAPISYLLNISYKYFLVSLFLSNSLWKKVVVCSPSLAFFNHWKSSLSLSGYSLKISYPVHPIPIQWDRGQEIEMLKS